MADGQSTNNVTVTRGNVTEFNMGDDQLSNNVTVTSLNAIWEMVSYQIM